MSFLRATDAHILHFGEISFGFQSRVKCRNVIDTNNGCEKIMMLKFPEMIKKYMNFQFLPTNLLI